jgi:5-hydroxyisourate hydrolase
MSAISTHVIDIMRGRPAKGITVSLHKFSSSNQWEPLAVGTTDTDGRIRNMLDLRHILTTGTYRLSYEAADYFRALGTACFFPEVAVTFLIENPTEHYHIPLLLSPYAYSTYRGT